MVKRRMMYGLLIVVLLAGVIAGCASQGVQKKLTAADAGLLPGTWGAWWILPGEPGKFPGP